MSDEDDNNNSVNFITYIYRGGELDDLPLFAYAHEAQVILIVDKSVTVVPEGAFYIYKHLVEIICHEDVKKISQQAFAECHYLRRVVMPGVEIVEWSAFCNCSALTHVECGKLEIIKNEAFMGCKSLKYMNLPSARIVEYWAFHECEALTNVKFSSKLEKIDEEGMGSPFSDCPSLERITIPLKDGLITNDRMFTGCKNLKHIDLVEREKALLHETITALNLKEWRWDMNREIDLIYRILPHASTGKGWYDGFPPQRFDEGGKSRVIQIWIRSVLRKFFHYQAEHQRFLNKAATILQLPIVPNPPAVEHEGLAIQSRITTVLQYIFHSKTDGATTLGVALPKDIVMNNILPFLALPSHTFEVEDQEMEEGAYASVPPEIDSIYLIYRRL